MTILKAFSKETAAFLEFAKEFPDHAAATAWLLGNHTNPTWCCFERMTETLFENATMFVILKTL